MISNVFVITGGRESGKTTHCSQLAKQKMAEGWQVTGLLSPARLEGNEKTGILAVDLHTGESHLLASRISGEIPGFQFGEWTFDPSAWIWGNQVLQHATPTDLLIVDEVGPLEFNLATGWVNVFDVLSHDAYHAALVVIRPECLGVAHSIFGHFQLFDLDNPSRNIFDWIKL